MPAIALAPRRCGRETKAFQQQKASLCQAHRQVDNRGRREHQKRPFTESIGSFPTVCSYFIISRDFRTSPMAAELRMAFAVATGAAIGVAVATYLAQKRQPKAQNTSCASSRGCWGETTASGTSTCCIGGSSSNDPGCCEDSGSDFTCKAYRV